MQLIRALAESHPPGSPAQVGTGRCGRERCWCVSAVLALLWLALMVGGVMWFYARFESHITVREQPVEVRLPWVLPALAEMSSPLDICSCPRRSR